MSVSVIAVIPARGGSKGLPGKNIAPLGGRPLIAWTIDAARRAETVQRVIVSTDDEAIARAAVEAGAEVPFLRPAEFAGDLATSEVVLRHALDWTREHERRAYDVLVYLQPTDPFRQPGIIDRVVRTLLADDGLDTAFAAKREHKNYWVQLEDGLARLGRHSHLPRQQKPPVYREDTGIALASRASVIHSGRRIGDRVAIVPHESRGEFIDIHTADDLRLANFLIEKGWAIPNEHDGDTPVRP
ncbi:MAG: acylneuraminate cytidylyltransferase family protein [Planctomyces sp.]|nr:acylneuraminate cytidylyltransferase family protein [Planctomyces sp.]